MEKELTKVFTPNIKGEMDEIKRVSQYLTRHENFSVSVDEVIEALSNAEEVTLTDELWSMLENTESNVIKKGEFEKVLTISKHYGKSNPYKLRMKLVEDRYERPMIVKFGDRYHLVSGNTRLSTAASMGMNPKVFIGDLNHTDSDTKEEIRGINESVNPNMVKRFLDSVDNPTYQSLKYIGINDHHSQIESFIDYYGGIDSVLESFDEYLSTFAGVELEVHCGGYELRFRYVDNMVDYVGKYTAEIMGRVVVSGDSEMSLFDGTSHTFLDIYPSIEKWEKENGYDSDEGWMVMHEIEDCIQNYFRDELVKRFGFGFYNISIEDIY